MAQDFDGCPPQTGGRKRYPIMPQPPADKDRWRRTLEELGLEDDAPPPPPPAPPPQAERPARLGNLPVEAPRERREPVPPPEPPQERVVEERPAPPVEAAAAPEEAAPPPV